MAVSQIFLVCDDPDSFKEYWSGIFYRRFLNLGFSDVFLRAEGGYGFWKEEHKSKVEFSSHDIHMLSTWLSLMLLSLIINLSFDRLLNYKVTFPTLFILCSGRKSPSVAHTQVWWLVSVVVNDAPQPWCQCIYVNNFLFFCIRDFSLFPHFCIYSIIYLYVFIDIYLILWAIFNTMLFILLIKLFLFWQLGDLLVGSSVPLTWPHYSVVVVVFF